MAKAAFLTLSVKKFKKFYTNPAGQFSPNTALLVTILLMTFSSQLTADYLHTGAFQKPEDCVVIIRETWEMSKDLKAFVSSMC